MPDLQGIYVIEYGDGRIKIGRSTNVPNRLRNHAELVEGHGIEVANVWTTAVDDATTAEALIKRMLVAHPRAERAGSSVEIWTGVAFADVVVTALAVLGGRRRIKLGPIPQDVVEGPELEPLSTEEVDAARPAAEVMARILDQAGSSEWVAAALVTPLLADDELALVQRYVRTRSKRLADGSRCPAFVASELRAAVLELGWHPADFGCEASIR